MSHQVTIQTSNFANDIAVCEKMKEQIDDFVNNMSSSWTFDKNKILDIKNKIDDVITNIPKYISGDNDHIHQQWQHIISTCAKEIANIINISKINITSHLVDQIKTFDVVEAIKKYGMLAVQTIEYLKQNNMTINEKNFEDALYEIRQKQASKNQKDEMMKVLVNALKESKILPKISKEVIYNEAKKMNNIQEISEVLPFIKDYENNIIKLNKTYDDLKKYIIELGLRVDMNSFKEACDINGVTRTFVTINEFNNKVIFRITSDGKIDFKLGNYEGHLCTKTCDKLLEKIKTGGYSFITCVNRKISDDLPLRTQTKEYIG